MKRIFSSIRSALVSLSGVIVVAILLSACSKFDDDDNGTDTPVSGLMAFNLVPDKEAIGVAIGNNLLTNAPLQYTNFTGTYQRIFPGNREVEAFDARTYGGIHFRTACLHGRDQGTLVGDRVVESVAEAVHGQH